jgi:hypothetical protein
MAGKKVINPPAYTKLLDGLTSAHLTAMADRAIANLTARGAKPPEGSRIHQARSTILTLHASKLLLKPGSAARRLFSEAHRTATEFYLISTTLNSERRVPPKLHQKLQRAYSGRLDPANGDEQSERARDLQFELYVGSWLAMSQRPIEPSGADLKVSVWFDWRGVAVKRLCSPRQLLKCVKKASAQLAEHHRTGFICVGLDNYSMRRNRGVVTASNGDRFFRAYPGHQESIAWLKAHSPHTLALVSFATLARWERGRIPPHVEMSSLTRVTVFPTDSQLRDPVGAFFEEVTSGFDRYWQS